MTRRTDVDVVRFLALVSMYVAHTAPTGGPADVLVLSEFLTMPLFALLVGVGAQLGHWRTSGGARDLTWWRAVLVKGGALVVVGLALAELGAQVLVVLVHLGVLVVAAALLARTSGVVVGTVGVTALVVVPLLVRHTALDGLRLEGWGAEVALFVWAAGPYRWGTMLVHAAVGILLARRWLAAGADRGREPVVVAAVALSAAAGLSVAARAGVVDLVPYSGTHLETVFDLLLAVGALGGGLAVSRLLPRSLVRGPAAAGRMTLTLYAAQIAWLAFWVRVLRPGERDDGWTNLAVLVVGSLLVAVAWSAVVRSRTWRRGPLEGAVAVAAGR